MRTWTVRVVYEEVQESHCKVEIPCHSAQSLGNIFRGNIQPVMTPANWNHAQYRYHILRQILEVIYNKNSK